MTGKQNSKGFILVFLGMLSAFGPFVMDMYLPTLPAMSDFFQTTSSRVQPINILLMSLLACWLLLALSME